MMHTLHQTVPHDPQSNHKSGWSRKRLVKDELSKWGRFSWNDYLKDWEICSLRQGEFLLIRGVSVVSMFIEPQAEDFDRIFGEITPSLPSAQTIGMTRIIFRLECCLRFHHWGWGFRLFWIFNFNFRWWWWGEEWMGKCGYEEQVL